MKNNADEWYNQLNLEQIQFIFKNLEYFIENVYKIFKSLNREIENWLNEFNNRLKIIKTMINDNEDIYNIQNFII